MRDAYDEPPLGDRNGSSVYIRTGSSVHRKNDLCANDNNRDDTGRRNKSDPDAGSTDDPYSADSDSSQSKHGIDRDVPPWHCLKRHQKEAVQREYDA